MSDYRNEDAERTVRRDPDFGYVQSTLMRSYARYWERWFDVMSGKAAWEFYENVRFMKENAPKKETGDFKRED